MPLPKTLIIGQPFNNDFGGGITQANLFGGWDKDKIAVVSTDHMFNNLNTGVNSFTISAFSIILFYISLNYCNRNYRLI